MRQYQGFINTDFKLVFGYSATRVQITIIDKQLIHFTNNDIPDAKICFCYGGAGACA
jgi:hypothetical protein